MTIPPRPAEFTAHSAPDGVELLLDAYKATDGGLWWPTRPIITPRLQLVHTNGAENEGSIESAIRWGNSGVYGRTHPHYQVDRDRAAKLVPSNRRGIGNATRVDHRSEHGNVTDWSLVIETADEGYPTTNRPDAPGEDSGFIGTQIETIAGILAYESILHGIPLGPPNEWFGAGTATHTEPFGYPYWTIYDGKVCPGRTKKEQMQTTVVPLARQIVSAWTDPQVPPLPPQEPDMAQYAKIDEADTALLIVTDTTARWLRTGPEVDAAATVCTNTVDDPRILLPVDCLARAWIGDLPHYRDGAAAGPVRVTGDMWAQTV